MTSTSTPSDGKTSGFFPPFFNGPLLTIQVHENNEGTEEFDAPELPVAHIYQDLRDIPDNEIDGRFVIEITPTSTLNREDYRGGDYWRYQRSFYFIILSYFGCVVR